MATKAVFLDYATMGPDLDLSPITQIVPDLHTYDTTPDELVGERIRDADFVIVNKVRLTDELLGGSATLRFVGLAATGTDNVDLDSARRLGVAVCNIRAYCSRSVAEHVIGVALVLTHNLHRYAALVRSGAWQQARQFCLHDFTVRELSSMAIGIVGYGELGQAVAGLATGLGMDVLVAARPGATSVPDGRISFEDMLRNADVVSLHCPLTDETRMLFGRAEFAKMKPTAILINTARGGLVDSAALVEALSSGRIAGAAIDVLPTEPPSNDDPLLEYEAGNLIVTPHIAWTSTRARQQCIDELAANIRSFLEGGERNRVV
jgi:glycerate dehydrogenase